jgi:hypothetical protein
MQASVVSFSDKFSTDRSDAATLEESIKAIFGDKMSRVSWLRN